MAANYEEMMESRTFARGKPAEKRREMAIAAMLQTAGVRRRRSRGRRSD